MSNIEKKIVDSCITVVADGKMYTAFFEDEECFLYEKLKSLEGQELLDIIQNPALMNVLRRTGEYPTYPVYEHGHRVYYAPCDEDGCQQDTRVICGNIFYTDDAIVCDSLEHAIKHPLYNGSVAECCPECRKVYKVFFDDDIDNPMNLSKEKVFTF